MSHPDMHLLADPPPDPDPPPAEPTDEELWLDHIAAAVEADARPLFAATWIWLLERALRTDTDDDEEPS